MKRQTAADLQQDYLDAIELTARHVAADSAARAVELLSRFAGELGVQSGVEFAELRVIALLTLCRIYERMRQSEESARTRREAVAVFDQIGESGKRLNIADALAEKLVEFGEFQRAIGPSEQALQLAGGRGGLRLAYRLWRLGRNYLRAGFKPHAEEPLRKSLQLFRENERDPHTPVILNDLGNALRGSNPAEAEECYLEAAAIWENGGAPSQASLAWVNLGILCANQGRLDESLEWYEKARRVRQADPATPRVRLGSLANNIANLHRRRQNFDLAAREIHDAIALVEGDPLLADACGTYGLILRDQGSDEASVEWFRRSRGEYAKQPSPDTGQLIDVLANEAAALRRLGRAEEAGALEHQLSKLRGHLPPVLKHDVVAVSKPLKPAGNERGAVLIELDGLHLSDEVYRECDVATLENRLEEVLESSDAGELDGHETGPENTTLFLYGANAEALFQAVEPVLREYPLCAGARVTIRQDDQQRLVILS